MKIARVALDVPLPKLFDYACPANLAAPPGARVVVPFGRRRMVGVVVEAAEETGLDPEKIKDIESVLGDAPTLPGDTTVATVPVTETTVGIQKIGTSVQVVNCSNQEGVARNMSNALAAEGFTMVEADTGTIDLPVTKIIYNPDDPAALAVATTLSTVYLHNAVVESSGPVTPTLTLTTWAPGSAVIVLLGDDLAGKTLAQIAGIGDTGVTSAPTVPPST